MSRSSPSRALEKPGVSHGAYHSTSRTCLPDLLFFTTFPPCKVATGVCGVIGSEQAHVDKASDSLPLSSTTLPPSPRRRSRPRTPTLRRARSHHTIRSQPAVLCLGYKPLAQRRSTRSCTAGTICVRGATIPSGSTATSRRCARGRSHYIRAAAVMTTPARKRHITGRNTNVSDGYFTGMSSALFLLTAVVSPCPPRQVGC